MVQLLLRVRRQPAGELPLLFYSMPSKPNKQALAQLAYVCPEDFQRDFCNSSIRTAAVSKSQAGPQFKFIHYVD